ncbi:MAG: DUF927 domain-containing protein [Desulfomonile tiedjei]|nr:DUF927 domain-containing protein [Desulfomonile tiedjei]
MNTNDGLTQEAGCATGAPTPIGQTNQFLKSALDAAARGMHVFALHTTDKDGKCSCGNPECNGKNRGKHPRYNKNDLPSGLSNATTDETLIETWWTRWPDSNIGLRTGAISGVWVLDIDGPEGEASLAALTEKNEPLPDTWEVQTGRGRHLYFKHPGGKIPNSASKVGLKIDVRGDGGYVILPPSNHYSGARYQWGFVTSPDDIPLAEAPEWLVELARADATNGDGKKAAKQGPHSDLSLVLKGVSEGQRDDLVFKYACSGRGRGLREAEIVELVRTAAENCDPPFPEAEWRKKISQAFKYPDGREEITSAQERVRAILSEPNRLRETAFEPESIGALAVVKKEDRALWVQVKNACKGFVSDLQEELTEHRLRLVKPGDEVKSPTLGSLLNAQGISVPDGCGDLFLPPQYSIDDRGIGRVVFSKDGEAQRFDVCPSYVLITGKREDVATGEVFLDVEHHTPRGWRNITAPKASFVTSHEICQHANRDFPVCSSNSRDIADYIFKFDQANADSLRVQRVSSQLGWTGGDPPAAFLLGDRCIGDDEITFHPADAGDNQIIKGFHPEGNFEDWQSAAFEMSCFPRASVMLYAAIAAVLLKIFDVPTFWVDLSGGSTSGKTAALMFAMSSWGNPALAEHHGIVHTWYSTPVALERVCATLHNLPVGVDDTKKCPNPKMIPRMIYAVAEGHGKNRGSIRGMQPTRRWSTIALSTGEAPLSSYSTDGGAYARVLSIRGLPFDFKDAEAKAVVAKLIKSATLHYGHLGPAWIEYILAHREDWPEWKQRYRAKCESYIEENPFAGRVSDMRAAIVTAGELIHESGLLFWDFKDPFVELWPGIAAELNDADVGRRALQLVYSWATANQTSFHGRSEADSGGAENTTPRGGWLGKWDRAADWNFLGIMPHTLNKTLSEFGYDVQAVLAAWEEAGWLIHDGGRKGRQVRIGRERVRVTAIRREAFVKAGMIDGGPDSREDVCGSAAQP